MEQNDIKKWEKIALNSNYKIYFNEYFAYYDSDLSEKITKEGSKYLYMLGSNLCGEILLESKYERRKRIVDKLLAESLEN